MALHLFAGSVAEVIAGLLFVPMEVVKSKCQVQQQEHLDLHTNLPASLSTRTTTQVIEHVYKHEGWRGFYNGYWLSLVVFVPQSAIYFAVYEQIKMRWPLGLATYLLGSMIASGISVAMCNPLDCVKTRCQVTDHHISLFHVLRTMIQTEGYVAFTRGTMARILANVPLTTISITLFEILKG
ncbi:mitochondrial carrier [Hesseltinella vesiculosa]|uniref:Mitochondrial carrier n=1 Tax=Hesseltinella vesiculosa TaxID=101127 RepID=A0A1X2GU02_9FUNG|nr:mitochondrial carrier [Hesseltinella vesiculosa]